MNREFFTLDDLSGEALENILRARIRFLERQLAQLSTGLYRVVVIDGKKYRAYELDPVETLDEIFDLKR